MITFFIFQYLNFLYHIREVPILWPILIFAFQMRTELFYVNITIKLSLDSEPGDEVFFFVPIDNFRGSKNALISSYSKFF